MNSKPDTKKRGWKQHCRDMSYNGYEWCGWLADEGLHLFCKQHSNGKYSSVKCRDSELYDTTPPSERSSFQIMADGGWTR